MTAALGTLIHDVEAAVAGGDAVRRTAMLRNVTSLFTSQAARLDEEQVAAFDTVIRRLAADIETKARAELSERLADIANAPGAVVRDLAFDTSVAVAAPILERSSRLDDNDLVAIAGQRGQAHLMAITKRAKLSERVTDVIVERGDQAVVCSVARNPGAVFSDIGYVTLADRAERDGELQTSLAARTDIPAVLHARLVAVAQDRVQRALTDEFGATAAAVTTKVASAMTGQADTLAAAETVVRHHTRKGDLDEARLLFWLSSGQHTEALVGLARLAGVPSQMAIHAFAAGPYEPMLFLIRSSQLGWRLLKAFLTARDGHPPAPEVMQGIIEAFQALSVPTAQRVVRFTAARDHAQAS